MFLCGLYIGSETAAGCPDHRVGVPGHLDYFRGRIELRKISALFHLRETMGKINGNQRECRQQEKILRQVRHSRSARLVDLNSHVRAVYPSVRKCAIRFVGITCIASDDGLGFSNALASPVCRMAQTELAHRKSTRGWR